MVAFRINNVVISITACIYAWIDFANNTYQQSFCNGFYDEIIDETDKENIREKYIFFIIYKTFSSIPFAIFSSFIVISLTYRSVINLIDYALRSKNKLIPYFSRYFEKGKDSFCCNLFNNQNESKSNKSYK